MNLSLHFFTFVLSVSSFDGEPCFCILYSKLHVKHKSLEQLYYDEKSYGYESKVDANQPDFVSSKIQRFLKNRNGLKS